MNFENCYCAKSLRTLGSSDSVTQDLDQLTKSPLVNLGQYAPTLAGGQPRPRMAPQPVPIRGRLDMQGGYAMDDEEMVKLRAERGGRAGGWSVELSKKKRSLEEAFASFWV